MKKLLIISLLLLFSNCSLLKKVDKKKETTEENQTDTSFISTEQKSETSTKITEPGGSIKTALIPLQERYDELTGQYRELKEIFQDGGLTKTVYYKPDGTTEVDCTAEERLIEIFEQSSKTQNEFNVRIIERLKQLESKEKEESSTPVWWFWPLIILSAGVVLVIVKKV